MTEPYYSDPLVTLYHGDCRKITDWIAANVLVIDPPYGIDYRTNAPRVSMARSIEGDKDATVRDDVLRLWLDRPALVFGTWRIPRPVGTRALLIWDTKGALGMGDLEIPWKPSHQEIYVLGREFTGRRSTDVLRHAPVQAMASNGRQHPHEKPLSLMTELISKTVGVVADPTAGVGTTAVAAKMLGRRCIAVELDERYCEIAAKRLAQGVLDFGVPA